MARAGAVYALLVGIDAYPPPIPGWPVAAMTSAT